MVETHSSLAEGLLGNVEFKCCMASLRDTSDVSKQVLKSFSRSRELWEEKTKTDVESTG